MAISKYRNTGYRKEDFRKNSYYWNQLVKQLGTWKQAEKAVFKSRINIDPLYILEHWNE